MKKKISINMMVFKAIYKDVLVHKCKIRVEQVRDDGTYVLVTYGQPIFNMVNRSFNSPIKNRFFLSPWGASFRDWDKYE